MSTRNGHRGQEVPSAPLSAQVSAAARSSGPAARDDRPEGTPMTEPDSGPGGIYSRLAKLGHGPARFTEDVSARMPTPEEARTAFDGDGRPVEVRELVMAGDRWQLSYEWAADC